MPCLVQPVAPITNTSRTSSFPFPLIQRLPVAFYSDGQNDESEERDPTIVLFDRYAFDMSRMAGTSQAAVTYSVRERYSWELLPGQDLAFDWSVIPPEPKDGLRARLRRR